jgi:hypothetical protein
MTAESEARRRDLVHNLYSVGGLIADYVGDSAGLTDLRIRQKRVLDRLREEFGSAPTEAELAKHGERLDAEAAVQAQRNRELAYERTGLNAGLTNTEIKLGR